jgi:hypothetical protein
MTHFHSDGAFGKCHYLALLQYNALKPGDRLEAAFAVGDTKNVLALDFYSYYAFGKCQVLAILQSSALKPDDK